MRFTDIAEIPGFSFRYGGKPSTDFLPAWKHALPVPTRETPDISAETYSDAGTGLKITVTTRRFDDFAAVDRVLEFENAGTQDTPLIEEILPLDATFPLAPAERLLLHHANGSSCRMDDFLPLTADLRPGKTVTITPAGGRSSDGAFPFMNLRHAAAGLIVAVGWSGRWAVRIERASDAVRLAAGMERTRLKLRPGEKIRTPRILLLPWEGNDPDRGTNLLRRLLAAHYLPRLDGELVMPPVAQCLQAYYYLTGRAGEQYEMKALPRAAALGADTYWIDACWYGEKAEWWQAVGSWDVNRERFPNGLRPVSDAAHEAGMKFVLWFEPERVQAGSQLDREHPEFLLSLKDSPGNSNRLFNLGMPEARRYITDLLSNAIDEHGVDVYRQDFNFDPLPYWQAADEPDRVGITEIRYIEGLYATWDELRRRHPHVFIDNCASGGRRIDLETLSRSLPLWPSDFPDVCGLPFGRGLHVGDQCINAGLARWVPLFGGGVWNFTPYSTRSEIIGGFTFGFHIGHDRFPPDDAPAAVDHKDVLAGGCTLLDDSFPVDDAAAAIAEFRSVRDFFLGDFHLLLPLTVSFHDWCAWQFHREDLAAGIAVFFRRHRSPFPAMQVSLRDIRPDAEYEVSLSERYGEAPWTCMSGAGLADMAVTIQDRPGSLLLRYRMLE
ncbi:MAG: alpha-galactosidase [Planctomycetes bacterium]|nr:alpha-galactosidase [Planctomycetota bacterium]